MNEAGSCDADSLAGRGICRNLRGSLFWQRLPLGLLITDKYNNERNIRLVKAPVLVLHGAQDAVNPGLKWAGGFTAQRDRIFVADGNQYFNRPGPRMVESLEILGEIFKPELFLSRYEGKGLMRYAARPTVKKESPGCGTNRKLARATATAKNNNRLQWSGAS